MKNKKVIIVLIIILSVVMIGLSVLFINLLDNGFKLNFSWNHTISDELVLDKEYNKIFNNIDIKSSSSEIYIKTSQSQNIKVIIYGDKEYIVVDDSSNELSIKLKEKNCIGFCFNNKTSKIEIYLPKDYSGKINIKNDYGNIEIDEFLNADLEIEEDCGNVKVLGGNIVNVNNDYGDVIVKKANTSIINEDCGNVDIGVVNSITAENNYGYINIDYVNDYLNLINDCGDIKVNNIKLNKDSYIKTDLGDIDIGNTNEIYIDAKTDLGNIKIRNNYNKSDITLKIENDCGDIKVNN